ncbi:MAG: ComF family protein [Bacteroidota bacterium]
MIIQIAKRLLNLIYPRLCILCNAETPNEGQHFCVDCLINMPRTNHFKRKENVAAQRFWGRFPFEDVASVLNFDSYSDIRWMIHRLKYEGRKDIGHTLGIMAGKSMLKSKFFKDIDVIIPIPLHREKKAKRGYNQAAYFGRGIAEMLSVPMREDVVVKYKYTKSQTKMSRMERIRNVMDSFRLEEKKGIESRHILIVDDVLTTGATIEACARILMEAANVKISIVTACIARN